MTIATAEGTFSTLRRLKNYLRSTMTQNRLNHIVLLHTHKHRTDQLDLTEVASDFNTELLPEHLPVEDVTIKGGNIDFW